MTKLRIALIDGNRARRFGIWQAIAKHNLFLPHEACFASLLDDHSWRNRRAAIQADVFLLHLNDQMDAGMPEHFYVQHINRHQPEALVLLYSGGGINMIKHTENNLILRQGGEAASGILPSRMLRRWARWRFP